MIKVGVNRQGTHRIWNYELKMRYSLKTNKPIWRKNNNQKQSENAFLREKLGSQWRWKEGYRLHTEEWNGLHEQKEIKLLCVLYQSQVKTS